MGFELIQDVSILAVAVDGPTVLVDVYGGSENLCASVRYTFATTAERNRNVGRLRRWAAADDELALLIDGSTVTFVNERSLLQRALASAGQE